jgi:hypothetical protein
MKSNIQVLEDFLVIIMILNLTLNQIKFIIYICDKKARARVMEQSMQTFKTKFELLRCRLSGFDFKNEIKNVLMSEQVIDEAEDNQIRIKPIKLTFFFFLKRTRVCRRL